MKNICFTLLFLFYSFSANSFDKFDATVCEASTDDSARTLCYRNAGFSGECQNKEVAKELACYRSKLEKETTEVAIQFDFNQPENLCNSLKSEGLQTQSWKPSNSFAGEFTCMTDLTSFGLEGASGLPSNIAFYVNGTQNDRANEVILKVNINNPNTRKEAFQKLNSATSALFKAFNESIPLQLEKAILNEKPVSFETAFGKAELVYESGRVDAFKVVITNKAFIAQKKEAVAASTGDFENCKSAIARVVGYSASNIQGDGEPVEEQGSKSFMFKGNNKDLFFCEIHPDRKYLIRAALGGQFPFKVIAEDHF